jgi:hypothetical protein
MYLGNLYNMNMKERGISPDLHKRNCITISKSCQTPKPLIIYKEISNSVK